MTPKNAKPKKPITPDNCAVADKWTAQRERERIAPKNIPHVNSTMTDTYQGAELSYRGRGAS